jgi:hypothetical protein
MLLAIPMDMQYFTALIQELLLVAIMLLGMSRLVHGAWCVCLTLLLEIRFGSVSLDPTCGDMSDYFDTTHKLLALQPSIIVPAHGPPSYRPIAMLQQYLTHRQAREDKILDSYQRGNHSAEQIVQDVYTDVAPAMWPFAKRNVEMHLRKLAKDGKITSTQDSWQ